MLDNVEQVFTDLELMLRKLKKASYEANMERFRREQRQLIDEMTGRVKTADDPEAAAKAVGDDFAEAAYNAFSKNGKVGGRKAADLSFFMIYYVFPAILLTNEECADRVCSAIRSAWNSRFKTNISYTDYDTLYGSFRNKIFGIF
ncbi:MAG: hypothetical protein K6G58_01245 [Lachnospiraceae bacterium]|nr:hypothetical protein [Lachnospiraceae bacterium]